MKKLLVILVAILLTSCLTPKRFNKIVDKAIKKGWIDSTTKRMDTTIIHKVDTVEIEKSVDKIIKDLIANVHDTTIYVDTCYSKQGLAVGPRIDTAALSAKLRATLIDTLTLLKTYCLDRPLFFDKDGVVVEVYQDEFGNFRVKTKLKTTTINRPTEKSWFSYYIKDCWFYLVLIVILILILILKK